MPLSPRDLQRVLAILADEDQLKVTVKSSMYGGVLAGVMTTVGGLLGGPPGMLVGGALGGAMAYKTAGDFKPVSQVIKDINAHDRQLLYDSMKEIIDNLSFDDILTVLTFLSVGPGLIVRQELVDKMVEFLASQLQLQVAN